MRKLILIMLIATNCITALAQEKITIIGNQQLDPTTKFMQGFLHGGSELLKANPDLTRIIENVSNIN
jgi:hypothetical protein